MSQYISLKVSGRPDSSGGYIPLVSFNNPAFAIQDQDYVGFDNNSYFFSVQICEKYTVYKLIKNNIRSNGGIRLSTVKIAFSIPRSYKLDNGFTPYEVLVKLKDAFLKQCLTCKDPVRETYEFNSVRIDQHILDDIASSFTISPAEVPYRCMKSGAAIAYLVRSEAEIANFFGDVNYPEFVDFSEVIIAENATQTNYTLLQSLQIPRVKSYALIIDGIQSECITDLNKQIQITSDKNQQFYDTRTLDFTIQSLLNGKRCDDIQFDEIRETINVSTANLATPIVKEYRIKIDPQKYERDFFIHPEYIILSTPNGTKLDQNLSFKLVGEQLARFDQKAIDIHLRQGTPYTCIAKPNLNQNGDISFKVKPIQQQKRPEGQATLPRPLPKQASSPIIDVIFMFKERAKIVSLKNPEVAIKLQNRTQDYIKTLAYCIVKFDYNQKNGMFEGHFYIPRIPYPNSLAFYFCKNGVEFVSDTFVDTTKDSIELYDENFIPRRKTFFQKNKTLLRVIVSLLIFITSFLAGYLVYPHMQKIQDDSQTLEEGVEEADSSYTEYTEFESKAITDELAKQFVDKAYASFMRKDVQFSEIHETYVQYMKNSIIYERKDSKGKIKGQINDYEKLVTAIESKDIESIKDYISRWNSGSKPHIYQIHMNIVKKIILDETILNTADSIISFENIEKLYNGVSASSTGTSKTSNDTSHPYTCSICGANTWFKTQPELDNHMTKIHNERL